MKQTIIIYKHNTQKNHNNYYVCYVYIIAHLYATVSYNNQRVNFRLFNAYKRYKVTKVKDKTNAVQYNSYLKQITLLVSVLTFHTECDATVSITSSDISR